MEVKSVPAQVQELIRSGYNVSSVSNCVTELVFNALDAQSEHVSIRINLVTFRIQVVDDGHGINEANLHQVGRRHFSHKCHTFEEFDNNFHQFGYKGEALASIAANALKITIVSRCRSAPGSQTFKKTIDANGHSEVEETEGRAAAGTTLTVEQFLHNLPVRQKCTKQVEFNEIQRILKLLFLVHPRVSFSLRDDSSKNILLATVGVPTIEQALLQQFDTLDGSSFKYYSITKGRTSAKILIRLQRHDNNKLQLFYVNKQPVTCALLKNSVNDIIRQSSFATEGDRKLKKTDPFVYLVTITAPRSKYSIVGANEVEFKHVESFIRLLQRLVSKCLQKEHCLPAESNTKQRADREKCFQHKFTLSHFPGAHKACASKRKNSQDVAKKSQELEVNAIPEKTLFPPEHSSQRSHAISVSCSRSSIPEHVSENLNMLELSFGREQCCRKMNEPGQSQMRNEKLDVRTEVGKRYILTRYLSENRGDARRTKTRQQTKCNCKHCLKSAYLKQRNACENERMQEKVKYRRDEEARYRDKPYKHIKLPKMRSAEHFERKPEWNPFTTFPNYTKTVPNSVSNITFGPQLVNQQKPPLNDCKLKFPRKPSTERQKFDMFDRGEHLKKPEAHVKRSREFDGLFNQRKLPQKQRETHGKRNFFNDPMYPLDLPSRVEEPQAGPSRMDDFTFAQFSRDCDFQPFEKRQEHRRDFFRLRASEIKSRSGSKTVTSVTICQTRIQRRCINRRCFGHSHHLHTSKRKKQTQCCMCNNQRRIYVELKKLKAELRRQNIRIAEANAVDKSVQCNMTNEFPAIRPRIDDIHHQPQSVRVISNVLIQAAVSEHTDSVIPPTPEGSEKKIESKVKPIQWSTTEFEKRAQVDSADGKVSFDDILKDINSNLLNNGDEWKEDEIEASLLSLQLPDMTKNHAITGSFQEYREKFLQQDTSLDVYFAQMSLENIFETSVRMEVFANSLCTQNVNEQQQLEIEAERRSFDVPKGFSQGLIATPRIDETVSSEVIRELHAAVCESCDDDLTTIKWKKHYLQNTDPAIFFKQFYDKRFRITAGKPKMMKTLLRLPSVTFHKDMFLQLDVLGQYDKKFIIAVWQTRNLVIIFDQHAVNERVRFEQLVKRYRNQESGKMMAKSVKNLRVPLSQAAIQQCELHLDVFRKFGIEWTHLSSCQIATIPECVHNRMMRGSGGGGFSELIRNIILEILCFIDSGPLAPFWIPTTLRDVINSEACRGAIMFGDELTIEECKKHIGDLSTCALPFICVHGRPTCAPLIEFCDETKETYKFNLKSLQNSNNQR